MRRILSYDVGSRNWAEAVVERLDNNDFELHHWENVDVLEFAGCKAANANKVPGQRLIECAVTRLARTAPRLLDPRPDAILIEQQVKRGVRNRLMATTMQVFFRTYYELRQESAPPIIFQSGSQKLKVRVECPAADVPPPTSILAYCRAPKKAVPKAAPVARAAAAAAAVGGKKRKRLTNAEQSARTRANKKLAVLAGYRLLRAYPRLRRWLPFIDAQRGKRENGRQRKKDDLFDVLLQAVYLLSVPKRRAKRDSTAVVLRGPDTVPDKIEPDEADSEAGSEDEEDDEDDEEEEEEEESEDEEQ